MAAIMQPATMMTGSGMDWRAGTEAVIVMAIT
jgi:hypothetical protein